MRQEYAQHDPDTLEKVIEQMMGEEDNKDETQSQSQRKKMTHETTSTSTNRPQLTTKTTRPKKGLGGAINKDISTQEKYDQGD